MCGEEELTLQLRITSLFHRETINALSNHCCGSIWVWSSLSISSLYSNCAILRMTFRLPEHFPAQRWGIVAHGHSKLYPMTTLTMGLLGCPVPGVGHYDPCGSLPTRVFHDFMISITTLRESDSVSQRQACSTCHHSKNTSIHGKGQGGYTEASPSNPHPPTPMEYIVIPRSICTKSFGQR